MQKQLARTLACMALLAVVAVRPAFAQGGNPTAVNSNPSTVCGAPIPQPAALPPANSGPVVYLIVPCFAKQGGSPVVEPETYLYYIQLRPSLPSQNMSPSRTTPTSAPVPRCISSVAWESTASLAATRW